MVPAQLFYDPDSDQLVVQFPAAEGDGDVVLLRIDVTDLDQPAMDRLRHVRDPNRPLPEPGTEAVTRRGR